jgi:hypothetical protein
MEIEPLPRRGSFSPKESFTSMNSFYVAVLLALLLLSLDLLTAPRYDESV